MAPLLVPGSLVRLAGPLAARLGRHAVVVACEEHDVPLYLVRTERGTVEKMSASSLELLAPPPVPKHA